MNLTDTVIPISLDLFLFLTILEICLIPKGADRSSMLVDRKRFDVEDPRIKQTSLRAREYQECQWVNFRRNGGLWIDLRQCSSCILRGLEHLSYIPGTPRLFCVCPETSSTISSFLCALILPLFHHQTAWPSPRARPERRPWFRRAWIERSLEIRSMESAILEAPTRQSSETVAFPSGFSVATTYNCYVRHHDYVEHPGLGKDSLLVCMDEWLVSGGDCLIGINEFWCGYNRMWLQFYYLFRRW